MPPENATIAQKTARYVLIGALVLAGAWMLRQFIPALCWAVVLAIATSSIYDRWLAKFGGRRREVWAALTFTVIVGAVLVVPLIYGGVVAAREAIALARELAASAGSGPPPLPVVARADTVARPLGAASSGWSTSAPATGGAGAHVHASPTVIEWTRVVGMQVARRVVTLAFTLLTLFFVYLDRDHLSMQVPKMFRRLFGSSVDRLHAARSECDPRRGGWHRVRGGRRGRHHVRRLCAGPRATPDPVGGHHGRVCDHPVRRSHRLRYGCRRVGDPRAPSQAPIAVGAAGILVLFVADHFVRPVIIGEGAKLPFLWALLAILGGVESFGLVGIFIGPALMAALLSHLAGLGRGDAAKDR